MGTKDKAIRDGIRPNIMKVCKAAGAAISLPLLCAYTAQAAEGVRLPGPIGGADIGSALLPEPGLYGFAGITVPSNTNFYDGSGNALSASGTSKGGAAALLVVWPTEILGGRIGTMILDSGAQVNAEVPGVLPESRSSGIGDLYVEPLFWSRLFPFGGPDPAHVVGGPPPIPFGLAVGMTVGISFPTGRYDVEDPVNVGLNHPVISPSVALTYTFPSFIKSVDAMELSGRFYYNYQVKNHANDYLSGDLVNLDFAATIRKDQYQFGLAGSWVQQIKDDKLDGAVVGDGNRARSLQLGPVATMNFMMGDRPWQLGIKALFDVDGRNTLANNIYSIRLATKFF